MTLNEIAMERLLAENKALKQEVGLLRSLLVLGFNYPWDDEGQASIDKIIEIVINRSITSN